MIHTLKKGDFFKKTPLLLMLCFCNGVYAQTPCAGLTGKINNTQVKAINENIARQLSSEMNIEVKNMQILSYFKEDNWSIIYAETWVSDEPLLIYNGDLLTTNYIALSSGPVRVQDEDSMKQWVKEKAPAMPYKLAQCFLWYAKYRDN